LPRLERKKKRKKEITMKVKGRTEENQTENSERRENFLLILSRL
jgi:hypothetical protein